MFGLRTLVTAATLISLLFGPPALAQGAASGAPITVENGERSDPPEILWDTWGVPHIYGRDPEGLFFAFGWAQMHAHADLLLRLYAEARGRAAEYWGEAQLANDRYIHTMGVPARAQSWYELQPAEMKAYLDAFVSGMNAYAAAHPERIADGVEAVLPVAATDVLAHVQRVIHLIFVGGMAPSMTEQWVRTVRGSNAWAVGPSRSASGHALLVANPHLPWGGPFTWFEAQLSAPGVDVYGAALVGTPVLGIAFNDHLGWTHTNNPIDAMDLYELELAGDGYKWNEGVAAFERELATLRVRQADGSLREEQLPIRRSVHGPVVAERAGKALAIRIAGLDQPGQMQQYWDMARAANLREFEDIVARLQNPFFNVIYADRDGHVMYLFGGRAPRRPSGDWRDWQGVVPGTSSANLWTETLRYDELPRVVDPPSGWVHNANDPPWTSTFPPALNANDFPPHLSPRAMSLRAQRSVRMIEDESITFDEAVAYKLSTRMELADRILDDLVPAARAHGGELAKRAADVLEAWDRSADAESRGAVLFAAWARAWTEATRGNGYATAWSEAMPRTTPDGLADPAAAADALATVAAQVHSQYRSLDVPWGAVYRIIAPGVDLPANGGPDELGIFRATEYQRTDDQRFRAVAGDSFQAVVEFADEIRAEALLSYGNASQPGSPHRGDQLALYARKELRPVWRTRTQIEANLEARETLLAAGPLVQQIESSNAASIAPTVSSLPIRTVGVNRTVLAYRDSAPANPSPALILVHGFYGTLDQSNAPFGGLPAEQRAITYSLRYHNPNPQVEDGEVYSAELHAADLAALITALDAAPATLIGGSYGGLVALETARRRPELVGALVLAEPTAMGLFHGTPLGDSLVQQAEASRAVIRAHFERGDARAAVQADLNGQVAATGDSAWDSLPAALQEYFVAQAFSVERQTSAPVSAVFPPLSCGDLTSVRMPTLLIRGERTGPLFHQTIDALAGCLPQSHQAVIPDAAHCVACDNPREYVHAVRRFLEVEP
jgi:acyl-homoserine-lactone acylase